MENTYTDFEGTPLEIGDEVVFIENAWRSYFLSRGKIIKLSKTMATIDTSNDPDFQTKICKRYSNICKANK